jgi:two-component system response regulator RegX3
MRIAFHHTDPLQGGRMAEILRFSGHEVTVFEGLHPFLDTPGARGFEVLVAPAGAIARHAPPTEIAAIRAQGVQVLALAALEDGDALAALPCDDFVLAPCSSEELSLRIDVLGQRARIAPAELPIDAPPYEFRADTREVLLHGRPVHLTAREFELALYLFRRMGRRLTRNEIAEEVWGRLPHAESRTLDAHVSSIRRKLSLEPVNGYRLCAHYGHGYCLTPVSAR